MRAALKDAGLQPKDISYINAHGTGTINNDLSEGQCSSRSLREGAAHRINQIIYIIHPAASGSVEAIFSVLSLYQYNEVYPSLRFGEAIEGRLSLICLFSECYSTEVQICII